MFQLMIFHIALMPDGIQYYILSVAFPYIAHCVSQILITVVTYAD